MTKDHSLTVQFFLYVIRCTGKVQYAWHPQNKCDNLSAEVMETDPHRNIVTSIVVALYWAPLLTPVEIRREWFLSYINPSPSFSFLYFFRTFKYFLFFFHIILFFLHLSTHFHLSSFPVSLSYLYLFPSFLPYLLPILPTSKSRRPFSPFLANVFLILAPHSLKPVRLRE